MFQVPLQKKHNLHNKLSFYKPYDANYDDYDYYFNFNLKNQNDVMNLHHLNQ
jgi:hypothetical protein